MMKKILVIDDATTILSVLGNIFSKEYEVIKKKNGREALDWIEEGNVPYVIIVDVNMPVMGGHEFITLLKASKLFSQIPIFVLTNTDTSEDKIKFLKLGVIDYILKPFNPQEIYLKVHNLIMREYKS